MIVAEVMARLSAQVATLALIEDASAFAAIKAAPRAQPAAYVILLSDDPARNTTLNTVRQRVERTVGVALATKDRSDATGGAAAAAIDGLIASVRDALIGWTPASLETPLEAARGRVMPAAFGLVWWLDEFRGAYYERSG